ncbi:AEC family transporter [Thiofilum flexile]|uniref:AEC family transporter n=1 Tax=Thiofilum flexile TaxID=125627 RepID=UPI00035F632D|nr:AEC family transporter [Thiofilum flexile]
MNLLLSNLQFALTITTPIFIILALGILLRHLNILTDAFIDSGSKIVFTVALPVLLFTSIVQTPADQSHDLPLIAYGLVATLVIYVLLELFAQRWIQPVADRGVIVQGAFRSNMGIIGLAYCLNAYGTAGVAAASLYVGFVTILFNILAVITLSRSLHREGGLKQTFLGILKNPFIIAIILALIVSALGWKLPPLLVQTGDYLARMALPLALLCTGGALSFKALRLESHSTLIATVMKAVIVPLLITTGGALLGFRGISLGILFLMTSAPTAAASYIMVRAMGGNAVLAANIIALTTLASIFTTSIGVTLLKGLELM